MALSGAGGSLVPVRDYGLHLISQGEVLTCLLLWSQQSKLAAAAAFGSGSCGSQVAR